MCRIEDLQQQKIIAFAGERHKISLRSTGLYTEKQLASIKYNQRGWISKAHPAAAGPLLIALYTTEREG